MTHSLRDAVYGLAVGDALGVPYEFMGRESFEVSREMIGGGVHEQPPGTFSDDTSMTLATCASLKEHHGCIDIADIRQKFENWALCGEYAIDGVVFDVGSTVARALDRHKGRDGERDNGNGSLMRIIPLAFVNASDYEIKQVSAITHAHDISMNACVRYIHIARDLIDGESLEEVIRRYEPDIPYMKCDDVKSGGFVLDTYTASLWCLFNTRNYKDAVIAAVDLGGDADTTAAVTGALAGITYGVDAIPKDWIDQLRGKDLIEAVL